jgi:hypothetical protein
MSPRTPRIVSTQPKAKSIMLSNLFNQVTKKTLPRIAPTQPTLVPPSDDDDKD